MLTDGIISIFYDGPRFAVIEEYTCAKRCSDFDCVVGLYVCMYVCMYNLYFRLRNTEQHSHTVLGSIDN